MACEKQNRNEIIDGDLLFCISESGNPITDVTAGVDGLNIEHVGIYIDNKVIEATPRRGVCLTPIDSFARKYEGRIIVGRVSSADISTSVENALSYIGLPYDDVFMPDASAIYCSELIQKSYVKADNTPVFDPIPMTFHDENGNIPQFWINFYKFKRMDIPEGYPGSNPGDLSRRECVEIICHWSEHN